MQADMAWRDEADLLIALHGTGAIGALVSRISDAVRRCDDQAVRNLDTILQLVEARLEGPWRLPPPDAAIADSRSLKAMSEPG